MTIVLAKLALAIAGAVAAILLARSPRLHALAAPRFDALAVASIAITRVAIFVALYLVARQPVRSDVPLFYVPQGLAALEGRVPYRDFASSYAPLFPYVAGAALAAWRSPLALVALAIAVEVASVPAWLRAMRACAPERTVRIAAALYATNAIPIASVAINGTNTVLCAASLAGSLLLARASPIASGLAMAAGLDAGKALAAIVAPVPFVAARARARWAIAFALGVALVYGAVAALGGDPLFALRAEAERVSAGTLPFLVAIAGGGDARWSIAGSLGDAAFAVIALAVVARALRGASDPRATPALASLLLLAFMLLGRKAYGPYLVLAFFPLCVLVASRWSRATIALWTTFTIAGAIERSAWAALDTPTTLARVLARPALGACFLAIDLAAVASHALLAWIAWRDLRGARGAARCRTRSCRPTTAAARRRSRRRARRPCRSAPGRLPCA